MSGTAGGSTILKEFLISLGFRVDQKTSQTFINTITGGTKDIAKFAASAEAAATAVVAAVTKMSDGLERLYYSTQRVGGSADSIRAISYAASQAGSSIHDMMGSLEGLAQRIRTNPGYAALANNLLGGKANLQDSTELMTQLGERFRTMPYYLANAYASALGISETTMRAMMSGMDAYAQDYRRKLAIFGLSNDQAAASGHRFMVAVRQMWTSVEILATKIYSALAGEMAGSFQQFDRFLVDHHDQIVTTITRIIRFILAVADIITRIILRTGEAIIQLKRWFDDLPPSIQHVIEALGLLIAAWRMLNIAFLTSPIGIILTLGAALALLWEDFETWRQGGKSFIDWDALEAGLHKIEAALARVGKLRWLAVKLGIIAPGDSWFGVGPNDPTQQQQAPAVAQPQSRAETGALPTEAKAMLDTIAGPESGGAYNVRYGGTYNGKQLPPKIITDFSRHPGLAEPGPSGPSSAAGRYQITKSTWDDYAPKLGVADFSPASQDRVAFAIASDTYARKTGGRDLLTDLRANSRMGTDTQSVIENSLRGRWPTINMSPYGSNLALENGMTPAIANTLPGGTDAPAENFDPGGYAQWRASLGAGGGASPVINQQTTINVNGAGDPQAVAGAVAGQQASVNSNLQRNLQGAVR